LFARPQTNGVHLVGKLVGHGDQPLYHLIGVYARLARELLPLTQADVGKLAFASYLHCEFDLLEIDFIISKYAGYIVQRSQTDMAAAEQQRKVFGMRISARDEPIKSHGSSEGVHIGRAIRRISAQKFDDVGWARSAFVLVLLRRHDPERLTNIFLMHPDDVVS